MFGSGDRFVPRIFSQHGTLHNTGASNATRRGASSTAWQSRNCVRCFTCLKIFAMRGGGRDPTAMALVVGRGFLPRRCRSGCGGSCLSRFPAGDRAGVDRHGGEANWRFLPCCRQLGVDGSACWGDSKRPLTLLSRCRCTEIVIREDPNEGASMTTTTRRR